MAKHSSVDLNASANLRRSTGTIRRSPDLNAIAENFADQDPVQAARMAVKVAEASGHVPAIVESLKRASVVLSQHDDWKRATRFLDRAISLVDRGRPSSELASLLLMRSRFRLLGFGLSEFRGVIPVAQRSFSIAEAVDDRRLMAEALYLTSISLAFIGDVQSSRYNFQYALSIAEERGDRAVAAHAIHGLGSLLLREGRYDEALENLRLSDELTKDLLGPAHRGIVLEGIAACLAASGDYRSADDYFQQAITMLGEVGLHYRQDYATIGHAISYINRGEAEAGLEMTYPVIGRMRTQRGKHCLCYAYYAATIGSLAVNDLRRAQDYANRLLRLAMSISDMGNVIDGHRLLASIAERSASSLWSMRTRHRADDVEIFPSRRGRSGDAPSEQDQHRDDTASTDVVIGRSNSMSYKTGLDRQSRDLLMSGLQLARKNEMILQLRHKVEPFLQRADDAGRLASEVIEVLGPAAEHEDLQGSLGRQFYDMSSPFLKQLSTKYPELTVTELKICTLLRSNLSSKEIARILNLSPHTVDTHRLQIRRKLGLSRTESLYTHLVSFE